MSSTTVLSARLHVTIARAEISVPDNERQILQSYPGYIVQRADEDLGHIWKDAKLWCWRTNDGSQFGQQRLRRYAIAALVGVVK